MEHLQCMRWSCAFGILRYNFFEATRFIVELRLDGPKGERAAWSKANRREVLKYACSKHHIFVNACFCSRVRVLESPSNLAGTFNELEFFSKLQTRHLGAILLRSGKLGSTSDFLLKCASQFTVLCFFSLDNQGV